MKVTVLDPSGTGAPAVGANVVFLDPDGALVMRASTDTNGKAQADVLPGGSVTSIALLNTAYTLQTVLAVKPGDDIILGAKNPDSTTAGSFTVSFPPFAGAAHYEIAEPCGSTQTSPPPAGGPPLTAATFTIFNSCKQDLMEIVVTATDANNAPLASLTQTGIAFSNQTATLSGTYQTARSFTASFNNINPTVTTLTFLRSVPDADGFEISFPAISMPMASTSTTATVPLAAHALVETIATSTTRARGAVLQIISGMAGTYGFDETAMLLPWILAPSFDAANGKILVPTDTTGTSTAAADMFRLTFSYTRTDVTGAVTNTVAWTVFAPDAQDITLPVLPAELASIAPTATDSVNVGITASIEMDTVAGYDAIRNDLNGAFVLYVGSRPPANTVRISIAPSNLR